MLLLLSACAAQPQKSADLIDNSNTFYGRGASTNKSNSNANRFSSSPYSSTISESEYYYGKEDNTVDSGSAVISSRPLGTPDTKKKADSSKGEIKPQIDKPGKNNLKWQSNETELEKSYKKNPAPANTNPIDKDAGSPKISPDKQPASIKKEKILSEKELNPATMKEVVKPIKNSPKEDPPAKENPLKKALESESGKKP